MEEEKKKTTVNKSGNKRGLRENNKQNFANNPKLASENGKKSAVANTVIGSITQNIRHNPTKRVAPEAQNWVREELFMPDESGVPYLHQFIHNFLDSAKKDPNGQAARILANTMFREDMMATLDAQLNAQMAKDAEFMLYRIRQTLYDKQRDVFDDNLSPTIECICTRRAGKTELVARLLVAEAVKAPYITPVGKPLERNAIYLNRSFDNAVGQMGKPVTELLDKLGLKYSGSPGSGKITLDSGASIWFGGYNNKGDIDKFRGYHYSLVAIDEISHLRNPSVLMKETLEPALKDYGHEGRTIMTGTPPRNKANYAYQMWHNPNIKHYHWSFMDNPYIPNKEEIIEGVCKEHGVTVEAPFVQREYYGNMEAFDVDAMIFRGYKKIDKLPQQTYDYAWIGVDWGYEDKAAVISMVAKGKQAYITRSWAESKKSISEICDVIKSQLEELKKLSIARAPWVICDTNEKSAVYELYQTYKIQNAYCAYKYDKDMAMEQLSEWCRNDTIFVVDGNSNDAIINDMENGLWKRDEETDAITHEIADDEYHMNAAFALLYASRQFDYECFGVTQPKSAKQILEDR